MGGDRRRRSKSRSRSRSRRKAPAKKPQKRSASRSPAKRREKEPPAKAERKNEKRAPAPAVARDESSDEDEDEASNSDGEAQSEEAAGAQGSLAERVALLEIENAALKAENTELKKKLIELIRGGGGAGAKGGKTGGRAAVNSKPGQASPPRAASPPKAAPAPPAGDRRARLAAAAAEPSERAQARQRPGEPEKPSPEKEEAPDDDMKQNAVMLVNGAMEAYNEAVPNNIPPEKRLPLVKEKWDRFMGNFSERIQIVDLKSGGPIIKDRKIFGMRYNCVFRESGSKLKGITQKRFYFDASGNRPTFSLDFETHENLVTATPGTPQDGKLGVRDPRTEHLIVLYEERGGKVEKMYLRPDTEKLGSDPTAGEDVLVRSEAYKAFAAKIKEITGRDAKITIFHNYHDTPTVG